MQPDMQQKDSEQIKREFKVRRIRQIAAIGTTLALLLLLAFLYHHAEIMGSFSKNDILAAQIIILCVFAGFSSYNWRCPSCTSYVGPDLNRSLCRHCGAKLR
jgi:hypothetical protein